MFEFVLAEALGMHLHELDEMPYVDYVRWLAFFRWRRTQEEHQLEVARMRARRRV